MDPPGQPTGPPELRVSDAERDQLVTELREHAALGRITLDEFAERTGAALEARTRGDLESLTKDLPALQASPPPARKPIAWSVAVMSETVRGRRWRVAGQTNAFALMGSVKLDLREAEVEGGVADITAVAIMGQVEIIVPEGMDVDITGFAIMGAKELKVPDTPPIRGMPMLRVRAFALMGAVTVRTEPASTKP